MDNKNKLSSIQQEIIDRDIKKEAIPKKGVLQKIHTDSLGKENDTIFFNYVNGGLRVEIHGNSDRIYDISYINSNTNETLTRYNDIVSGEWVQSEEEYYIPWTISIHNKTTNELKNYTNTLKDKIVLISVQSSALGDNIAWLPVIDRFREKNNCKVVCRSVHSKLFSSLYPEITFIDEKTNIQGMQIKFSLGWFGTGHKSNRNPIDCHTRNLQQIAMDILGLDYEIEGEIRPKLHSSKTSRIIKNKKYVAITTCSTAQFKYWNRTGGWQDIVNFLTSKGYGVVNIGKQPNSLKNVIDYTGARDMDDIMNIIEYSDFFIGLPSGLSWLSWGLGKKTIMITGISEHFCEFKEDMYRVENNNTETGCVTKCFNNPEFIFDRGSWLFCPLHKDTDKHFICTKSITPEMVKKKIVLVESHLKNRIKTILDREGNLINKKTNFLLKRLGE